MSAPVYRRTLSGMRRPASSPKPSWFDFIGPGPQRADPVKRTGSFYASGVTELAPRPVEVVPSMPTSLRGMGLRRGKGFARPSGSSRRAMPNPLMADIHANPLWKPEVAA